MFVKLWMRTEVITVQPEDTISAACSLMEKHHIRRIPVIDPERRLLGIISKEDIKKALPSVVDASLDDTTRALANQVKVSAFMTRTPITVQPTDTLEKIATLMLKNKIGGIPVIENDLLAGIITESDIFRAFVQILGGDNKDIRIELCLSHDSSALYNMFELLNAYDVQINNIAICNNHSPQTRSITLRIASNQSQTIIDELWKMGCKITSVITDN
jgi:acetoin utilization protein AcuB